MSCQWIFKGSKILYQLVASNKKNQDQFFSLDINGQLVMGASLYLQLIQQLIELQNETTELQKEGIYNWPRRNNYVRKPERPTIALDFSETGPYS